MTATTVRVEARTKRELDRLQGLIQAETGVRVTHSELLGRMLRVARKHEADLLTEGETGWRPPTREQIERVLRKASTGTERTDASKVDDVLYGGSPHA